MRLDSRLQVEAIDQIFSIALVEAQLILAQVFFDFDVKLSPKSHRRLDVQWAHMVSYSLMQALQLDHYTKTQVGMGETCFELQADRTEVVIHVKRC